MRNPDDDLPADFEDNRDVHYAAIKTPLDGAEFTAGLKSQLTAALASFDKALAKGKTGGVRITTRRGEGWIHIPSTDKVPEPPNLDALKAEVHRRWGTIDLLNMLKEADFLTGFTGEFTSVMSREAAPGGCTAAPAAVGAVRAGDECRDQTDRRRLAVVGAELGDIEAAAAAGPRLPRYSRQPAQGGPPAGQRHAGYARPGLVGARDSLCK